jgi:hypothetical protein
MSNSMPKARLKSFKPHYSLTKNQKIACGG